MLPVSEAQMLKLRNLFCPLKIIRFVWRGVGFVFFLKKKKKIQKLTREIKYVILSGVMEVVYTKLFLIIVLGFVLFFLFV